MQILVTFCNKSSYYRFKKPYFNGKTISSSPVNILNNSLVPLNGTDLVSVSPGVTKNTNIWGYIDDMYRTLGFTYNSNFEFKGLDAIRFT
jgi:hypothetical protein